MEQGDPEALTAPWALQGFPQGPGCLRGGSGSAGEEGERFVPNVELAGAHIPSSPAGLREGAQACVGKQGQAGSQSVGEGSSPGPSSTDEGKCKSRGLPKPPALRHRGPRVRDHAEFRAEAKLQRSGWPGGKPRCCRSLRHCELLTFPPGTASPHLECVLPPPHAAVLHAGASRRIIKVGKDP